MDRTPTPCMPSKRRYWAVRQRRVTIIWVQANPSVGLLLCGKENFVLSGVGISTYCVAE